MRFKVADDQKIAKAEVEPDNFKYCRVFYNKNKEVVAVETYRDPSKVKDYEVEFIEGIAKFKVFGKECAPSIIIPVNKDGSIDTSTYNKFIVKAPSIIEAGIDQIVTAFESGWWQDVFPNKKATKSDFIKAFRYISEIDIKLDDDNKECVVVMLEGDSPMDEEHGIGVKIINNKVVKCGTGGYFGE